MKIVIAPKDLKITVTKDEDEDYEFLMSLQLAKALALPTQIPNELLGYALKNVEADLKHGEYLYCFCENDTNYPELEIVGSHPINEMTKKVEELVIDNFGDKEKRVNFLLASIRRELELIRNTSANSLEPETFQHRHQVINTLREFRKNLGVMKEKNLV